MSSDIVRRPLVSRTKKAHLAYLEITDFKSYAGSHKLGPLKKGMNCIVGPNGSGKSNLMEAICWVLGVETRHLRGIKMADLAYRKEGEGRSVTRRPEVKLSIHVEDNEGNRLETKTFMRRVADNRFHFLIDEKIVEKDSYYKALAVYGILPKVQNCIVSQGQVESLSMKSEKEKGVLFDEVSGSALLKPRYDDLKLKLREYDLELRKVTEKIKRKDVERKSYEAQAKELEEFEVMEKSIKHMDSQLYLFKLFVNISHTNEITSRTELMETAIATKMKEAEAERKRQEGYMKTRRELEEKVANLRENRKEMEGLTQKLEKDSDLLKKRIKILKENVSSNSLELQKKQEFIDENYNKYRSITARWLELIEVKEKKLEEIDRKVQKNAYYRLSQQDKNEYEKKTSKCQLQTTKLRSQILESSTVLKRLKDELHHKEQSCVGINDMRNLVEARLKDDMMLLNDLKDELLKYNGDDIKQVEELRKSLHMKEKQQSDLLSKQQQCKSRLESISSAKREDKRSTKFQQVVEQMKQKFPNKVFGRLSHLCDLTNNTYSVAVSVAMGLQADSIVCDTFQTAQMAIRYLKEIRHPPVEFLPLDRLKTRRHDDQRLHQYPSLFIPIINCISFDPRYSKAFLQVLEDVVVVDNLDAARELAYKRCRELNLSLKIVTLDGQKILKNCNIQISGGAGIDRRQMNRFEEKQQEENFKALQDLEKRLHVTHQEIESIENCLIKANTDNNMKMIQKEKLTFKIESLEASITSSKSSIDMAEDTTHLQNECKQLKNEIRKHESLKAKLEQEIQTLENTELPPKLIEWNKAKHELDQLEQKKSEILGNHQIEADKCEYEINDMIRALNISVANPATRNLDEKMQALESELENPSSIQEIDREIGSLRLKIEEYECTIAKNGAQIKENRDRLRELEGGQSVEGQLETIKDNIGRSKKAIKAIELSIYELGIKRTSADESLAEMDQQATDILNEIVSKSIVIPTKNGSFQDLISTWTGSKQVNNAMVDESSAVDIDFSGIPDDWVDHVSPEKSKAKEADMMANIKEKKSLLSAIHPNFKAREQYEEAKESFATLKRTQKDLSAERQKVDDDFAKCKESRSEKFRRCFEKTKTALESIYSDLTKGTEDYSATEVDPSVAEIWKKHFSNVPGGVARLELVEEPKAEVFESGIAFHAMPPGKRFTEMDALSGGEKSMATLALLFALQSHRPSPFVVLDEVDAALDVSNVQSLRNWLKRAPFQVVIVTLKDEMYCHADAIIGVYKDHENESSGTLSLDVEAYS